MSEYFFIEYFPSFFKKFSSILPETDEINVGNNKRCSVQYGFKVLG